MTTLDGEDSEELLASLENCASPEEMARREELARKAMISMGLAGGGRKRGESNNDYGNRLHTEIDAALKAGREPFASPEVVMAISFEMETPRHQCPYVSPTDQMSRSEAYICCTRDAGHEGGHEPHWAKNVVLQGFRDVVTNMRWHPRRRTDEERLRAEAQMLRLVIHAREREMNARDREGIMKRFGKCWAEWANAIVESKI